jgi:pantetheine-phosphate adenylyltransferase
VTRALYPGTFDPITNGHLDVIRRASRLFDELVIAVAESLHKDAFLSMDERRVLIEASISGTENVQVTSFKGLLADEFEKQSVNVVIRGLRAVSDFEYELMLALMNRKLNEEFETVFLMPSEKYIYLHSSLVREVYTLGGDISSFVPGPVLEALQKKRGGS